ncbi:class I glutamine amidotransferase-like protein [Mycena rebaudengoi]|nr:class I glutamine amidotransferase-like protein [Mycena rebaudengoi]
MPTAIQDSYDALIIPGGAKGAEIMSKNPTVQGLVREFVEQNKIVGIICAGSRQSLTLAHPSVKSRLENHFEYSEDPVVISGTLVQYPRGPGTTFPFALSLVELLCGPEKREEVRGPMVFPPNTPL